MSPTEAAVAAPSTGHCAVNRLPTVVLLLVWDYCPARPLLRDASRVCRRWRGQLWTPPPSDAPSTMLAVGSRGEAETEGSGAAASASERPPLGVGFGPAAFWGRRWAARVAADAAFLTPALPARTDAAALPTPAAATGFWEHRLRGTAPLLLWAPPSKCEDANVAADRSGGGLSAECNASALVDAPWMARAQRRVVLLPVLRWRPAAWAVAPAQQPAPSGVPAVEDGSAPPVAPLARRRASLLLLAAVGAKAEREAANNSSASALEREDSGVAALAVGSAARRFGGAGALHWYFDASADARASGETDASNAPPFGADPSTAASVAAAGWPPIVRARHRFRGPSELPAAERAVASERSLAAFVDAAEAALRMGFHLCDNEWPAPWPGAPVLPSSLPPTTVMFPTLHRVDPAEAVAAGAGAGCLSLGTEPGAVAPLYPLQWLSLYHFLLTHTYLTDSHHITSTEDERIAVCARIVAPSGASIETRFFHSDLRNAYPRVLFVLSFAAGEFPFDSYAARFAADYAIGTTLFRAGYGRVEVDVRPEPLRAAFRAAAAALGLPAGFPPALLWNVAVAATGSLPRLLAHSEAMATYYNTSLRAAFQERVGDRCWTDQPGLEAAAGSESD